MSILNWIFQDGIKIPINVNSYFLRCIVLFLVDTFIDYFSFIKILI